MAKDDRLVEFRLKLRKAKEPAELIDDLTPELLKLAGWRIYTDSPVALCAEKITENRAECHIRIDRRSQRINGTIRVGEEGSNVWRRFRERLDTEFPLTRDGELAIRVRPTEAVHWDKICAQI